MTVYDATSYAANTAPKIVYGGSTFYFDDDSTRVNILDIDITHPRRVQSHIIPGQDGELILGSDKAGMEIRLDIEIASIDLQTYAERMYDLHTALEGGDDNLFDFYYRYENADNYWCYEDCVCTSVTGLPGPHDPYDVETMDRITGSITMRSQKSDPTIEAEGVLKQGDAVITADSTTYVGATTILIVDQLIVQNSSGVVKCVIDATVPGIDVVGSVTQS